MTSPLNLPAPGRCQAVYVIFQFGTALCFCQTVAWTYSLRPTLVGTLYPEVTGSICLVP